MRFNPFQRKSESPDNDRLLNALVALAGQPSEKTHKAFYAQLLESALFMAEDPEAAPRPILFMDAEDHVILPIFTNQQRLVTVCPDAKRYGLVSIPQVCQLALQNGIDMININPEQGPGTYLIRDEIEALANNKIPPFVELDSGQWNQPKFVPMGDSKLPDEETLDRIAEKASAVLSQEAHVDAAYIILYASRLTIALEYSGPEKTEHNTTLTKQMISTLEATFQMPFHVLWLDEERLNAIRSRVDPFYRRQKPM